MKKKCVFYLLFVVLLTVVFLYCLFPVNLIKNYMAFRLNRAYPDINITIDRIKPTFPPGIGLYKVSVYQLSDILLILEKIKIVPDLLSLFRSNITFFFKANTCDGEINGRGELIHNSPFNNVNVDAAFDGIQLAKINAVQGLKNRKISGALRGHLSYKEDTASEKDLTATLIVSDGNIKLLNPILPVDTIMFDIIESNIAINNRSVQFKQCNLKGPQMDGSMTGSIILQHPLGRSVLKLAGSVRPHPTLLANLKKDFPENLIPKKLFSKNGLSIMLNGTLENPIFSMN